MKTVYTLIVFTGLILTSCSKPTQCVECQYSDKGDNKTSGEVCGTTKEVNSVKIDWEKEAESRDSYAKCKTWTK